MPESEAELNAAFARFKDLADRKSEIFDEDIIALLGDGSVTTEKEHFGFVSMKQHSETGEMPQAELVISVKPAPQATVLLMLRSKPLKPM